MDPAATASRPPPPGNNNNDNNNNTPVGGGPPPGAVLASELSALPMVPDSELLSPVAAIQGPNVSGATPEQRTRNMQKLFNNNRPELFMMESRVIGTRVDPGSVRLLHLNNVPEMVTYLDGPREFRPGKGLDVREVRRGFDRGFLPSKLGLCRSSEFSRLVRFSSPCPVL